MWAIAFAKAITLVMRVGACTTTVVPFPLLSCFGLDLALLWA